MVGIESSMSIGAPLKPEETGADAPEPALLILLIKFPSALDVPFIVAIFNKHFINFIIY